MRRLIALVYALVYTLAFPLIVLRLLRSPGDALLRQRFGFCLSDSLSECFWLHASSVGEVALLEPVAAALQREHPGCRVLITAFTPTGVATAAKRFPEHVVHPFPFDYRSCVGRFAKRFNPRLAIIVESEFWPAFLGAMHERGIPVAVLNGKMSERSMRRHARTRFVAQALQDVAVLAMQDEANAARMRSLGVPAERVHVTGNMKYDLVAPAERSPTRDALGVSDASFVIVGGSLHDGEDAVFLDAIYRPKPVVDNVVVLLAPRYTHSAASIAASARRRGLRVRLRTELPKAAASSGEFDVCIIDTLGELRSMYSLADVVFVGGSMTDRGSTRGGHNLMEPAICAVPVLFGPFNYSFAQVADELARTGGGRLVHDSAELRAALQEISSNPRVAETMGAAARGVVIAGQGASAGNLALVRGLLEPIRH